MPRRTVDLAGHLNETIVRGHPADFSVTLRPVLYRTNGSIVPVPNRAAVVREDTGEALAVVSDRYTLVPHQRILDCVEQATRDLDVGSVPRGIYVDRRGARMRAVFKFPSLARQLFPEDGICPCLKIQNTYDGTSRITVHIGAFRFVCTNLAVGGGGVFAGGFMAIHAGDIPIGEVADQLRSYLSDFDQIVEVYSYWTGQPFTADALHGLLAPLPKRTAKTIRSGTVASRASTVYDAYNVATYVATHEMRSYRSAFDLLEWINRSFQEQYPLSGS